jgi:hypothetical protein
VTERERRLPRHAQDLVRQCRVFVGVSDADPSQMADFCTRLDQFSRELAETAHIYQDSAAWCRLAAGLLRGEDVPESIHVPAGEDPADTARWRRWRVS